jgi:hypothetical protein
LGYSFIDSRILATVWRCLFSQQRAYARLPGRQPFGNPQACFIGSGQLIL